MIVEDSRMEEQHQPAATMIRQGEWTRVVVLAPPTPASTGAEGTSALSPDLRSLFAERDWFAIEQHDPYLALAELCLRERAQVARAAWGLQRLEQIALLILQPQRWPAPLADDLARAVRRCLPDALVYAGDDAQVTLYPEAGEGASFAGARSTLDQPATTVRTSGSASAPRGPQVHDLDDVAAVASQAPSARNDVQASAPSIERISRDEIDMLLREDADDVPAGVPTDGAREQRR
jgi:hypothetical protein